MWKTLLEAVRGTRIDYTTAPVGRAIAMLAVPMVLEMSMESIFAVADVFWVAHLGADAVATIGLTESFMTFIYTAAMGLSIGATALVARRIGEHDRSGASSAAGQSILLGVGTAVAIAAVGAPNAAGLLRLMGAPESVVAIGAPFTRIMLAGNATVLLLFLMNAVFRGAGDAAIAMRVLMIGNALNIVLGPCFIFGLGPLPRLGVAGAAVATNIGRGTAVLIQIVTLARGRGRIGVAPGHLRLDVPTMRAVLRLSGSGTFQILVGSASYVGLVRIVSLFGAAALAGYTIGIRVVLFALLPAYGVGNAAATMVGQNLGARSPERAERAVWTAARYNTALFAVAGAAFFLFARPIATLFTSDPAVAASAIACLRIIGTGMPFYACAMVLTQSFNGAGDTWTPTVLNLAVLWAGELPLGWWLSTHTPLGARGAFIALALCFSSLALISALVFRRGKWKTSAV
jgi:putative MATE family efflux protein